MATKSEVWKGKGRNEQGNEDEREGKRKEEMAEINICHPNACTAEKRPHSIKADFFSGTCLKETESV
jgi:hypothetical protein